MTNKEKKIQIALGTYLDTVWKERKRLYVEGVKLRIEGYKIKNKGLKLRAKDDLLRSRSNKLKTGGDKLIHKGGLLVLKGYDLFTNAVIEILGKDITIEWDNINNKCTLSNGQEFE